jgi:hypothetical protein
LRAILFSRHEVGDRLVDAGIGAAIPRAKHVAPLLDHEPRGLERAVKSRQGSLRHEEIDVDGNPRARIVRDSMPSDRVSHVAFVQDRDDPADSFDVFVHVVPEQAQLGHRSEA